MRTSFVTCHSEHSVNHDLMGNKSQIRCSQNYYVQTHAKLTSEERQKRDIFNHKHIEKLRNGKEEPS